MLDIYTLIIPLLISFFVKILAHAVRCDDLLRDHAASDTAVHRLLFDEAVGCRLVHPPLFDEDPFGAVDQADFLHLLL